VDNPPPSTSGAATLPVGAPPPEGEGAARLGVGVGVLDTGISSNGGLAGRVAAGADGATTLGQVLAAMQLADAARDRFNLRWHRPRAVHRPGAGQGHGR
jgi:hypothetical protein